MPKQKSSYTKILQSTNKELLEELKDAQGCVWALGVSQKAVTKEEYHQITHDYPLAFATALTESHTEQPFTFIYISGEGATQTPGPFTPIFGRVKGLTESSLFSFSQSHPTFKLYNVRPGAVDWRAHPEIHPFIPYQAMYKRAAIAPMSVVYKSKVSPTRETSRVLVELAMGKGEPVQGSDVEMGGRLIGCAAMRRLGGI